MVMNRRTLSSLLLHHLVWAGLCWCVYVSHFTHFAIVYDQTMLMWWKLYPSVVAGGGARVNDGVDDNDDGNESREKFRPLNNLGK